MAAATVKDAVAILASEGYRVTRAAVLLGSGKPLPELGKILAAHPLIHTAEGVFFREVLKSACDACGLAVVGIERARGALEKCAAALRISVLELQRATFRDGEDLWSAVDAGTKSSRPQDGPRPSRIQLDGVAVERALTGVIGRLPSGPPCAACRAWPRRRLTA